MNPHCQGFLLFLLVFNKFSSISGAAEKSKDSESTDSSAKKKTDDQKWLKKLKDYKPSTTDSAVAKYENKDGATDAAKSQQAQPNPKGGPDLWNTVNQGASCIEWGQCRNMHSSWHRNQRRTYGKRVRNVIGMGELFCIRLWPCEEKRAEFCMFHALDGNVTVYKLCRIWFDPDY